MKRNIKQPCATSWCSMNQNLQCGQREDDHRSCKDKTEVVKAPAVQRAKHRIGSNKHSGKRWSK